MRKLQRVCGMLLTHGKHLVNLHRLGEESTGMAWDA